MAAADVGTVTVKFDPESLAILERLAVALEALVTQQKAAPPPQSTPSHLGPFLGDEQTVVKVRSSDQPEDS